MPLKPDLMELMRTDLRVVIGANNAGAIGKATQICLRKEGIYDDVSKKALFLLKKPNPP